MKLNDLIDPSNTKQRIARYKEKMNDEIYSFLDSFKCNGEELVVNQLYDGGTGHGKIYIDKMCYRINFADNPGFQKIAEKLRGDIRISVGYDIEVRVRVPSMNMLSNYNNYINDVVTSKLNNTDIHTWGTTDMWIEPQVITKRVMTVPTATKYIQKFIDFSVDTIQKGLTWSQSKEIQDVIEFTYQKKLIIKDYDNKIGKLCTERNQIERELDTYNSKLMENFKKEREMMKDFQV